MPYSWNRPPVPIDKTKQGGKNMDASAMTGFLNIGTISKVNVTKLTSKANRNQQTNLVDMRKAAVLISGLQTIPRAVCYTCPTFSFSQAFLSDTIAANVSAISFYVFVVNDVNTLTWTYTSNTLQLSGATATTANIDGSGGAYRIGFIGTLGSPTTGLTRQIVVDRLDAVISTSTWNAGASRLRASLNTNGTLRLTIEGTQLGSSGASRDFFAGLAFGDAPNGSTSLGVTNLNGAAGVAGAMLAVVEGQTFVDSPYRLIDY